MARTVSVTPFVKQVIVDYKEALRRRGIPFDRIVVFGSHAKGVARPTSDIDVCVVSPAFGVDYHRSLVSLVSAASDIEADLDVVAYTPSDLSDRYDPLASEIRAHGQAFV